MKAHIGLIGLAVMGENLVLNMTSKGFTVAVFNRTMEKVNRFISGRGADKNIIGCQSIEKLCDSLERPRKIMMLIKAGEAVDNVIESLVPFIGTTRVTARSTTKRLLTLSRARKGYP